MLRFNRKAVVLVAAVALVITALVAPTASTAKGSVPFKIVGKLHFASGGESKSEGTATVTIGSKSYKGAKVAGSVSPPNMITRFAIPGGSVTTVIHNGKITNGVLVGNFTLKGTGKYANIKGSGKLNCLVAKLIFTWSGTATL